MHVEPTAAFADAVNKAQQPKADSKSPREWLSILKLAQSRPSLIADLPLSSVAFSTVDPAVPTDGQVIVCLRDERNVSYGT